MEEKTTRAIENMSRSEVFLTRSREPSKAEREVSRGQSGVTLLSRNQSQLDTESLYSTEASSEFGTNEKTDSSIPKKSRVRLSQNHKFDDEGFEVSTEDVTFRESFVFFYFLYIHCC